MPHNLLHNAPPEKSIDQLVFENTFTLYTTILSEGCPAPPTTVASSNTRTTEAVAQYRPFRDWRSSRCTGDINIKVNDRDGRSYLA